MIIFEFQAPSIKNGLTQDLISENLNSRTILEVGHKVIIVSELNKLIRTSATLITLTSKIQMLVTDQQADPENLDKPCELGIEVLIAE